MKYTKQQLLEVKSAMNNILKEATAYERGADRNLKKKLSDISELNGIYMKRLNNKQMTTDEFDNLISQYTSALRDFKLYKDHWDK